ncbi:hypothetical protein R9X37_12195 [Serratia marcescens]|uniref:hypothetical protein n=1 Tax=Serratia marcescens TaxID=615 RepID=UPI00298E3335|nr:hypothetical protein [Serratia marcescens]MDW7736119.1 hypothetical protein [Serratia marcescens]
MKVIAVEKQELMDDLAAWGVAPNYARFKHIAHKNGTTPHPPAQFGSGNFFSSDFLQNTPPGRATPGALRAILN